MKNYKSFPFKERKQYEETFVENNSGLIQELQLLEILQIIKLH